MKDNPTIGVLAGMGPRSTSPFLEKVLDQCQIQYGATYDIDFPPIIIYSVPTPFYVDRPIDHNAMKASIVKGLQRLEKTGVAFIAMPCNSAHRYFETLDNSISISLLNMVNIVIKQIPEQCEKIGILGTETTIEMQLYQQETEKIGAVPFHNSKVQNIVNSIISDIKYKNDIRSARYKWNELTTYLEKSNVDLILSACTDLQLVTNTKEMIPVLDPAVSLAERVVTLWREYS